MGKGRRSSGRRRKPAQPVEKIDAAQLGAATGAAGAIQIGRTGLNVQAGQIFEADFKELDSLRRRTHQFTLMQKTDATAGAVLFVIENMIRNVEWIVEPAKGDDGVPSQRDEENALFVRECMDDMNEPWEDVVGSFLSMNPMGFHLAEPEYKFRRGFTLDPATTSDHEDGNVGWRNIAVRSADTVDRWIRDDATGEIIGWVQMAPPDFREIPIPFSRALHFRPGSEKDNPEGRSIFRNAWLSWYRLRRIEEAESIGVSRDLTGIPVAEVPWHMMTAGASAADKATLASLEKAMTQLRMDERASLIIPQKYDDNGNKAIDFSLLGTPGTKVYKTDEIIMRKKMEIAMVVLADFLFLGQAQVGSFALVDSRTQLFSTALGATLKTIAGQMNRKAIPMLFLRNQVMDVSNGFPKVKPGDVESISLEAIAEYIAKLVTAGAMGTDDELERDLRNRAGLPEPEEEGGAPGRQEFDDLVGEVERMVAEGQARAAADLAAAGGGVPPKEVDEEREEE